MKSRRLVIIFLTLLAILTPGQVACGSSGDDRGDARIAQDAGGISQSSSSTSTGAYDAGLPDSGGIPMTVRLHVPDNYSGTIRNLWIVTSSAKPALMGTMVSVLYENNVPAFTAGETKQFAFTAGSVDGSYYVLAVLNMNNDDGTNLAMPGVDYEGYSSEMITFTTHPTDLGTINMGLAPQ